MLGDSFTLSGATATRQYHTLNVTPTAHTYIWVDSAPGKPCTVQISSQENGKGANQSVTRRVQLRDWVAIEGLGDFPVTVNITVTFGPNAPLGDSVIRDSLTRAMNTLRDPEFLPADSTDLVQPTKAKLLRLGVIS